MNTVRYQAVQMSTELESPIGTPVEWEDVDNFCVRPTANLGYLCGYVCSAPFGLVAASTQGKKGVWIQTGGACSLGASN